MQSFGWLWFMNSWRWKRDVYFAFDQVKKDKQSSDDVF